MSTYERLVAEETLIFDATEEISRVLDQNSETTRAWLARRLGKSKGFVSQVLSGDRNMTLRTLAQIGHALDQRVEIKLVPASPQPNQKGNPR